jgi:hypothetical protein
MMAFYHKKQEELKKLQEDDEVRGCEGLRFRV